MLSLLLWFTKRKIRREYNSSNGESKESLRRLMKKLIKARLIAIVIDIVLVVIIITIVTAAGVSIVTHMTAGVSHVATDIVDVVDYSDSNDRRQEKKQEPRIGDNCPCGNCILISNSPAYTTGKITGNSFDAEVLKLSEALARDTDSFVWMPYAKSAVEYSGALTKQESIYTNYNSIYTNYTDKLDKADRYGSIGLTQITVEYREMYTKQLTKNEERFKRAVQSVGGNLEGYTSLADNYATNIYEDRLYLPSQLGIVFYFYEASKGSYDSLAKEYIPGYLSMGELEREVILEMLYLASWNNGLSGTKVGLQNSENGKLGQYIADLARLYVDDNHFRQLIKLDGVDYLGGNNYTKVVESVIKYMGKNVEDYINSTEVNGGDNDWTSRVYCYITNGLLGGSSIFVNMLGKHGENVTRSLAKKGQDSDISVGETFEDIQLTYNDNSVDGEIVKEYETIYDVMDYNVHLLEIGDDYDTGGSSDLPNRKLDQISGIVIHYTGGAVNGTAEIVREWFDLPYNPEDHTGVLASSHFAIGVDGKIIQLAPLDNETRAYSGPNEADRNKISIVVNYENVNGAFGSKAYNSLLHLTAWLAVEFNIDTDTSFIKADKSVNNVLYRDVGAIQRNYDVNAYVNYGVGRVQTSMASPLYWVPNDGSTFEEVATGGGNARWISFKKDLTSFILTYKDEDDFAPLIEVPGLEAAKALSAGNGIPNWQSGKALLSGSNWMCGCSIPCPYCDCHSDIENVTYEGELTGKATANDHGHGTFKGNTWASSQFLDNAKTVIKAMIDSGYGYSQTRFYDPIGNFYAIRYDCSGYVSAVLHYSGYTAFKNHTSRNFDAAWDSHYGWTRITNFNDIQAGDILVMESGGENRVRGQIGHVEIYAGDKKTFNVGSDYYLTNHPNGNPEDAKNKWSNKEDRFLFAWRITKPN